MITRYIFVQFSAPHPIIWVTPFLHPETTLLGMALGLGVCRRFDWRIVAILGLSAAAIFALATSHYFRGNDRMWLYPVAAIMCGSAVWLSAAHRVTAVDGWIVYLGKITFGLLYISPLGDQIERRAI